VGTVNLLAVFDTWKSAAQSFDKASQALGKAADQLCDELTAAGAAWGHDELGQAFFNGGGGKPGFGTSRDEVLPLIGDMVNVLAGSSDALAAAQAVYLDAEQANAQLSGGKVAGKAAVPVPSVGGSYRLPPYTGGMTANDPPPAGLEWMMNLVTSLVAGCEWPDGSIGGLEKISSALSSMATAMGPVIQDVRDASTQVIGSNIGLGPESFGTFSEVVILALEQVQQALKGLASSVGNLVAQKKAAWIQLVASMVFLVASFFVAQAIAVWTLGASEAEFFATAEAEGWTLRMFFQLLAKGVLEGLWYGGGMDAVGQVSRIITGAQHGWNWAEFGKAAGEGAVAGAVMSGLTGAARFAGGRAGVVKALFNVMDGKVDDPSAMTKLAGFGARVGFNSTTGFAGNLASQAAFDDGNVNLTQAGSFAVGMSVMGEGINLITPGEHGKAPDTDPPGSDVPAAIDEARTPSGVQAALTTTLHDPSASDHGGPAVTDSDDKPPPPPPPPPGGPGGTPVLDDNASTPPATHLASISTTHDQATADSPLTPVTPTPSGDHPDVIPVVTAGHDGPTVLADHTTPTAPDTLDNGTPGGDARPLEPTLRPTDTVTPTSPTDTGFAPQHPTDQVGPAEATVGSPASSHDALASAGRDPADGGTEIRTPSSEPPAQPGPDPRADFNPPQHAGDGATVSEDGPPASDLAGVGRAPATIDDSPIPGAHDLTSSAPIDDAGISGTDRPPVDLRPASDATSPEDVVGGRMDANDARQMPVAAAEDRPLADEGRAGTWDASDDATRSGPAAGQRDDVLGAGDGRDISGEHSDQETLPDDDLDREFADLVNSDHGGLDRELADLLNSDRSGLALAGPHGGADDIYYSEDGHVGTKTPAGDVAPHDDQGLPRDDTSAPTQGHDPARDDTSAPTRDHDPARDDTSPANHGHSPAHDDASARDHGQQVHDSAAPGDHTYPPGTEVVHVDLTGTAFEPPEAHRGLVELGSDYRTEDGEEIPLFKGKPGPEQVAQGGLRNCFAMAVLRSVARTDPDAIADNIWENPDGTITVRLHEPDIVFGGSKLTGRIVEIRMSKELPVYAEDPTRPAYANVRRGGAAWPGYYERALAAINEGGFARLDEGGGGPYISGFLTEITGKPSFYDVDRDPYNAAANWKKLLDAGNPVIVGTKSGLENPKFGLFSPHAYEVVDVVDGHVILKNPHGRNDPEPIPLSEWSDHFTGMWASKLPPDAGQHEAPALSDTAGGDRVATDPARAEPTSARPDTTEAASGDVRHPASGGQASAGGPADRTGSPSAQPAHDPATSSHGGDTHSADPARSPGDVTAPIQHPADAGVVPRAPASPAQPVHIPQDPAGPVFRNADPGGGPGFTPHAEVRFGADVGMPGKLDLSPGREILLGRGDESPLRLALRRFDSISRRHATIGADADGTPWIRDEGSTNGTFVNGQQIPAGVKVPLPDGAVVRLGDSTDLHIGGAGIPRAHDPVAMSPAEAHTAPIARAAAEGGRPEAIRAEPAARAVPEAVRPDVAQRIPDQPPPVQVKFGADFGRPGTVDISPGREVLIGRSDDSPLGRNLWPFEEVSRRHATIGADPDGTPWIRDEGSSNGTFVNGERIPAGEKVPLPPGARVRLGSKTEIDVSQGDRDPGNVSPAEAHTPPVARADPAVHPDAARPDPAHAARQDPARPDAAHPDPARPDPARPDAVHAAHPDPARVEHRDFGRAVPRKLRQIVADHPGVLDAPRRLGELKDNLRPGVSFDDMRSLRELSYRLNGVEPPSLSRETFDELLGKVWSQRFSIKNDNGVYREYAVASEENPLTRSYRSYLDEIAGIAQGRTHGTIQAGTGKEAPDSLSPENAADVDPDSVGFVHFHRDYADPNSVSQRVYVNARADSAPALMHAFVHEVVDDPRRFPGIFEAKITGPHGAGRRSDNIVIYTDGEAANQHVISWLKKYQSKHDAFMWSVPPMTEQVMEGVATGAEPLVADRSFGGLRSEAIYQALEESMLHGDDFAGFLNRALGLLPRYYVDSQTPHMNNS
jgi:pSer/pThr/pTyr-binding forkhead associated (FHA) protein